MYVKQMVFLTTKYKIPMNTFNEIMKNDLYENI